MPAPNSADHGQERIVLLKTGQFFVSGATFVIRQRFADG
jgi:hypothetical protein